MLYATTIQLLVFSINSGTSLGDELNLGYFLWMSSTSLVQMKFFNYIEIYLLQKVPLEL